MLYTQQMPLKVELGLVAALAAAIGCFPALLIGGQLEDAGYHTEAWIAFAISIAVTILMSIAIRLWIRKKEMTGKVVMQNQQGSRILMSKEAYAFPIEEGMADQCFIERDYTPSQVDVEVNLWGSEAKDYTAYPEKLAGITLESGQRYYVAAHLDEEVKRVVPESTRGWWPYKVVE